MLSLSSNRAAIWEFLILRIWHVDLSSFLVVYRRPYAHYINWARYNLSNLLRLHKIVKDLGLKEYDVINALELAKHNELENLQWKVEYLRNELDMLENEKWKSTNQILKLNRMIDEFEASLTKKRGERANMIQETGWYGNTGLYPTYLKPNTRSYSIQLSYAAMNDYWP